jgi:hypothetical protein
MPTDLTEIQPLERRVDTLLKIDTASGESHLLIVEAQGKKDPGKPASWAYYVAHLYAKYRIPPVLLVTCQDKAIALSAITHGKDDNAPAILKALAAALKTLDEETERIFAELTELGLGAAPAAEIWRHLMSVDLSFFRSETSQRKRAEGRAEDILLVLGKRGIEVSDDAHERITACTDLDTLKTWLSRSLTATTADDLYAVAEA